MQKNKLLLTSALVGAAMLTSASVNAEIKVTGYLEQVHIQDSSDATAGVQAGSQPLKSGTELDLVFTKSGIDLGNGMKGTVMANITNEANATANGDGTSMGLDAVVLTVDTGKGFNLVLGSGGFGPGDIGEGAVPTIFDTAVDTGIQGIKDANQFDMGNAYSIGATAGGFAFAYTPNLSTLANKTTFDITQTQGEMRSAYEIAYKGSPIAGTPLTVSAAMHKAEGYLPGSSGQESITYGVGYSIAGVNVGVNFVDADAYAASGTQVNSEQTNIGITYTYQGIGLGVTQSKDKISTASSQEQKATSYQVGYALGPIGVALAYTTADNVNYTAGRDGEATTIRLSTKF